MLQPGKKPLGLLTGSVGELTRFVFGDRKVIGGIDGKLFFFC